MSIRPVSSPRRRLKARFIGGLLSFYSKYATTPLWYLGRMSGISNETTTQSGDNDAPESPMAQVRELARKLYGSYGEWVEANFGVVCMECNLKLPAHTPQCSAGIKNKALSEKWNQPPSVA